MRLIDADDLIEIINQAKKKFPLDDRNARAIGNRQCLFWIGNEVKNQPTAYDVDAVIEELQINEEFYRDMDDDYYYEGMHQAFSDAIDIVKRGRA